MWLEGAMRRGLTSIVCLLLCGVWLALPTGVAQACEPRVVVKAGDSLAKLAALKPAVADDAVIVSITMS